MEKFLKIGIIGGDRRQLTIASEFIKRGHHTAVWGISEKHLIESNISVPADIIACDLNSAVSGKDVIILPLPISRDGINISCPLSDLPSGIPIDVIFGLTDKKTLIFAGKVSDFIYYLIKERDRCVIDYYNSEELQIKNSVPTAEGAIAIAINALPFTLHSSNSLILGYGRIGKTLSALLYSMGANVIVSARSAKDLAWINAMNYTPLSVSQFISEGYDNADVIFNTIPAKILDREVISKLKKGTVIIDLAVSHGGIDIEAADDAGIKIISAPSLPGKISPQTAGINIFETIYGILKEKGMV